MKGGGRWVLGRILGDDFIQDGQRGVEWWRRVAVGVHEDFHCAGRREGKGGGVSFWGRVIVKKDFF